MLLWQYVFFIAWLVLAIITLENTVSAYRHRDVRKKSFLGKIKKRFVEMFKGNGMRPQRGAGMYRSMPAIPLRGWVATEYKGIPKRAFLAGYNEFQKKMYVARVMPKNNDTFSVGFMEEGSICARVAYDGYAHCYKRYQILIGEGYKWMENILLKPHPDAIFGDDKHSYYVCRKHSGSEEANTINIGFVDKEFNCWFGAKGIAYKSPIFELLIDMWNEF